MKMKRKETQQSYKNDLEYLEDWFGLIDLLLERKRLTDSDSLCSKNGRVGRDALRKITQYKESLEKCSHQSQKKGVTFALDKICQRYRLNHLEKEILIILLYKHFSPDCYITNGRSILDLLATTRLEMMKYRHYLSPYGKLRRHKLLTSEQFDNERNILDTDFDLPDDLISEITGESQKNIEKKPRRKRERKSYRTYLDLWFSLIHLMEKRADMEIHLKNEFNGGFMSFFGPQFEIKEDSAEVHQDISKIKEKIIHFGSQTKEYPLEMISSEYNLSESEKLILVILLRESLGLSDPIVGCEGKKLLALISSSEAEMIKNRILLYPAGKLRKNNLIRQEKSWPGQNILDSEYSLSEKVIRRLLGHLSDSESATLTEEETLEPGEDSIINIIQPRYNFEDVIIDDEKREQIRIALYQEKNKELIFKDWGFGEKIHYGRNLAMLFSGPPGTGKTMMAEAIASSLNKKLFVCNYAQIQNLYVGETEKRIVSAFKKAKEENAVLVWDEADAMFYSREVASHSWESRDINVILQQIEQFPGVVILTTNRKTALDNALERRLTLKVDFDMPQEKERLAIWRAHIPSKAPLASDVDLEKLSREYPVSGGIIKNALLIAARCAAARASENKNTRITMADLIKAVEWEIKSSWTGEGRVKIGF